MAWSWNVGTQTPKVSMKSLYYASVCRSRKHRHKKASLSNSVNSLQHYAKTMVVRDRLGLSFSSNHSCCACICTLPSGRDLQFNADSGKNLINLRSSFYRVLKVVCVWRWTQDLLGVEAPTYSTTTGTRRQDIYITLKQLPYSLSECCNKMVHSLITKARYQVTASVLANLHSNEKPVELRHIHLQEGLPNKAIITSRFKVC